MSEPEIIDANGGALARIPETGGAPKPELELENEKKWLTVKRIPHSDDSLLERARRYYIAFSKQAKALDDKRLKMGQKSREQLQEIDKEFEEDINSLNKAAAHIKKLLNTLQGERRAKAITSAQKKLAAVGDSSDPSAKSSAEAQLVVAEDSPSLQLSGLRWTRTYSVAVDNISDVPREFLTVDAAKVKSAYKGGRRDFPGLRVETGYSVGRTGK